MGEMDSGASVDSPTTTATGDTSAASPSADSGQGQSFEGGTSTQPATSASEPGPIPYARFREVNERMKSAEARWSQIQQQYGDLPTPDEYRNAVTMFRQFRQDPVASATELLNALAANEQFRPAVASQAARVLNSLRGMAPKEDPEPQPDLVAENGAPVYSAQQQRAWLQWNQSRMQQAFEAKLAEATKPLNELRQEREVARVTQHAHQEASRILERAKGWHGFEQHKDEIAKVFREHPDWRLEDAYLHVLHEKILPSMPARIQTQVVADLQQKAAAQSMNPSSTVPNKPPDFKGDFAKALAWASRNQR